MTTLESNYIPWLFIGGPWHGKSFTVHATLDEVRAANKDGTNSIYRGELRGSKENPYRVALLYPTPEQLAHFQDTMKPIDGR